MNTRMDKTVTDQSQSRFTQWLEDNQRLVRWLIWIVIVGVGSVVLWWPQYSNLLNSGVLELEAAQEQVTEREQYVRDLETMTTNYETGRQDLEHIAELIVPSANDSTRWFEELELVFVGTSYAVESINLTDAGSSNAATSAETTTGNRVTRADIHPVRLTVNVSAPEANYAEFKELLATLESHNRVLDLEALSYSSEQAAYTFVLTTYQRK